MPMNSRSLIESNVQIGAVMAWLELLLITIGGLLLGYAAQPDDPFFLNQTFPWPLLGPILVALRYGFFYGFVSSLLVVATLAIGIRYQWLAVTELPYTYTIGVVISTMLVGEFRDHWQRMLDQLHVSNSYRQLRLDEFTRSHHLLKVSHDRMEQQLAGSGQSLRDAIRSIHRQVMIDSDGLNADTAKSMLNVFAEYGALQRCAILSIVNGEIQTTPLATIGHIENISSRDPLVVECLRGNVLVSVNADLGNNTEELNSQLLVCAPISDSAGKQRAVLVIERMSFFALQDKTLRLLAIIAGHIGDMLSHKQLAPDIEDEDTLEFSINLSRSLKDKVKFDIPAVLVLFNFPNNDRSLLAAQLIRRMQRGLDVLLEKHSSDKINIALLLPITDELGYEGYRQRLEDFVHLELGKSMIDFASTIYTHNLQSAETLTTFLQEHNDNDEQMVVFSGVSI